jgi:ATP-binding cassette subfamily C protein
MSEQAAPLNKTKDRDDVRITRIIATYIRAFRAYSWQLFFIFVLALLGSVVEALGITTIVPLFSFVSGSSTAMPTDTISSVIAWVFTTLHIAFSLRFLLMFIATLFVVRIVLLFAIQYITAWVGYGFERKTRETLFSLTMEAGWPFLSRQRVGHLEQLLTTNTTQAAQIIYALETTMIVGSKSAMYIIVALMISGWIGAVSLLVGLVAFIVMRPLLYRTRLMAVSVERINREMAHFTAEHIIGMKAVKSMAVERSVIRRADQYFEHYRTLVLDTTLFKSIVQSGIQIAGVVYIGILFVVLYRTPGFSLAAFAIIVYAINQIFSQVQMGQTQLSVLGTMTPYLGGILHYFDEARRAKEREGEGKSFVFEKEIRFENLTFSYPERSEALSGISFTIPKGHLVGIIGPSGAGKTTIADLLLRLVEPTNGRILSDQIDIHDISKKTWRSHVGYVSQDAVLLNDTIRANIRFYNDSLSHEDVIQAAKLANIHDFIETLPGKYDSVVGDRGIFLSGGQRQRVALARVLARKPAILVLDEATSALDSESERAIQRSIEDLRGDVTVVIIAHRMTTVENVDTLVVLEQGRVMEVGSPKQLATEKNSYFARMLRSHVLEENGSAT